jgi:iron complex outermembrane recepter protein
LHIRQGTDPHNQIYIRSSWDIKEDLEFDLIARYVDNLQNLNVPSYISMDMRLGWRPRKHLELAVVGQNLLESRHPEFNASQSFPPAQALEVPRGVYGTITWRY